MRYLAGFLIILTFVSCSSTETPENIEERIDQLIAEDQYEQALDILNNADPAETEADLPLLKEKTHLNYGLYLEYRGPENSTMRERMTSALEQFIAVLKINSENEKARQEIRQIMGVYETMPDRAPGEDILEELRALGFNY